MFEKWRIKEHMEVADSAGRHVGTVDEIVDADGTDRIKLTRSDAADGAHHFVDLIWVDRIEDNRVYLKPATPLPMQAENAAASDVESAGSAAGGNASGDNASANYAGSEASPDLPGLSEQLFGTSGHGTGMGGSGIN